MVDQNLVDKLKSLMEDPSQAQIDDFQLILEFLRQFGAEDDDMKEEMEEMDIVVQLVIKDKDVKYWLKAQEGKLDAGDGEIDNYSFTFSADFDIIVGILTGGIDTTSAYMSGDITVEGNLQDAMAFVNVLEIAMDAFEDMTGIKRK